MGFEPKSNGWILFELVIVLVIFAFISGLSISFYKVNSNAFVRLELQKLNTFIVFLYSRAQIQGKEMELNFDLKNNSYSSEGYKYFLGHEVEFGILKNVKGSPSLNEDIIDEPITFENKKIKFFPDETMSSGTIYLTDKKKSCLFSLTIPVGSYAHIRMYQYDNKKWNLIN